MHEEKKIICKELDDELMIFDETTGTIHFLNPAAKFIWEAYQDGKSVKETEDIIRENFEDCDGKELQKHIEETIALFKDKIIQ